MYKYTRLNGSKEREGVALGVTRETHEINDGIGGDEWAGEF